VLNLGYSVMWKPRSGWLRNNDKEIYIHLEMQFYLYYPFEYSKNLLHKQYEFYAAAINYN